jgi:hypothetical protein
MIKNHNQNFYKVLMKHIKEEEQNKFALFLFFLCLCHPSTGRIVILRINCKNLFLRHSSCPAIFPLAVFEILQKASNEKELLFFTSNEDASFGTNSQINLLPPVLL